MTSSAVDIIERHNVTLWNEAKLLCLNNDDCRRLNILNFDAAIPLYLWCQNE